MFSSPLVLMLAAKPGLEAFRREPRGVLLLAGNRAEESIAWLETFRRLRPVDPQGVLYLGQAYAQVGRIAEARRVLGEGGRRAEPAGARAIGAQCREILQHLAGTP